MRALIVALASFTLAACQSTMQHPLPWSNSGIPPGSTLTLTRDLAIPPQAATVYIQRGQAMERTRIEETEPHCIFEVRTLHSGPSRISPDTFEIYRINRGASYIGGDPSGRLLASLVTVAGDTTPTQVFYKTVLYLSSDAQPDVVRITCQSDQNRSTGMAFARYLTVDEIEDALQGLFHLDLAGDKERRGG